MDSVLDFLAKVIVGLFLVGIVVALISVVIVDPWGILLLIPMAVIWALYRLLG